MDEVVDLVQFTIKTITYSIHFWCYLEFQLIYPIILFLS